MRISDWSSDVCSSDLITAGVAAPRWQMETSAFRGREPDEFRWNIEETKLDSWSVRASFAPSPAWLLQVSYGEINEPEELHLGEDEHRTTASAHYNNGRGRSEEHTSELQSLMRISYAVFYLK